MNFRIFAVACVLGCAFCMGCGGDDDGDDGGGSLRANCEKVCSMTAPLNCPMDSDNCVNECQLGATASPECQSVIEAGIACSAKRPASDFACNPDTGESELSEEVCTSETEAVIACLTG